MRITRHHLPILCLVSFSLFAVSISKADIPHNDKSVTSQKFKENLKHFYAQELTETYKKNGRRDPAWDEKAIAYLEMLEDYRTGEMDPSLVLEIIDRGQAIQELGCDDALIDYGIALGYQYNVDYPDRIDAPQTAIRKLGEQGYSPRLQGDVAATLALTYMDKEAWVEDGKIEPSPADAEHSFKQAVDFYRQDLSTRNLGPEEARLTYHALDLILDAAKALPPDADEVTQQLSTIVSEAPNANAWLTAMIRGHLGVKRAWAHRGTGFANTVTPEGWKGFYRHLNSANEYLQTAHRLRSDLPEAATQLITVTMGGINTTPNNEEERYWFDQAVHATFDWIPAYDKYLTSQLPRWGGSQESMIEFARECMRTFRFDTQVPYQAVTITAHLYLDNKQDVEIWRKLNAYSTIKTVLSGYAHHAADPAQRNQYLSALIMVAYTLDMSQEVREYWEHINGQYDPALLRGYGQPFRSSQIPKIFAETSVASAIIAEAETASENDETEKAIALFADAEAELQDDPIALGFVRDQLMILRVNKKLSEGEWADLHFDVKLSGWRPMPGRWTRQDESTIHGESAEEGLTLRLNTAVGKRFELKGDFAFLQLRYEGKQNAGLLWIEPDSNRWQARALLFYHKENNLTGLVESAKRIELQPATVNDKNHFSIQRWDDQVQVSLNGEVIYTGLLSEIDEDLGESESIAIGGQYWYDGTQLSFSNLKIRQLNAPPITE